MVSVERPNIEDVKRPEPIRLAAPPECFQDGNTYRKSDMDCILCDFFDNCKV